MAVLVAGCARGPAEPQANAGDGSTPAAATQNPAPTAAEQPAATQPEAPAVSATGTAYQVVTDQSEASYSVGETFLGQKRDVTAVGKTSALAGTIVLDGGVIQASTIEVDVATLKTDESRRDNKVRQALDTANHPKATYRITGAEGNPALAEGQETALKLQGTMTIKGVDKPLTFDAKAKLEGGRLTLTAETVFDMTEFGVDPPNVANFVAVQNEVKLAVTFVGESQG